MEKFKTKEDSLPRSIIQFFDKQNYVLVSTANNNGMPNCVPKGIAHIDPDGIMYVVDLYNGNTWKNLKRNQYVTITAVDERHYTGYQLKGRAKLLSISSETMQYIDKWKRKLSARIASRLIENLQKEKKTHHHEAHFPPPKGIIAIHVKQIINLTEKK